MLCAKAAQVFPIAMEQVHRKCDMLAMLFKIQALSTSVLTQWIHLRACNGSHSDSDMCNILLGQTMPRLVFRLSYDNKLMRITMFINRDSSGFPIVLAEASSVRGRESDPADF